MEWDKIEVFYYVAKARGFSAAAKQIHLTQSALSRSVGKLEEQLGKKLFIRHAKGGLSFTREGETLFQLAEQMVHNIHSTKKIIQGDDDDIKGELRILTTPGLGSTWLMCNIAEFLNIYPQITLSIKDLIDNFKVYESDAIITTYMPHQPDLIQVSLTTFHMQLYASEAYLHKYGKPLIPKDLNQHKLIAFEGSKHTPYGNTDWILQIGNQSNENRPLYMTVNSTHGLFNAANQGLGIVSLAQEDINVQNSDLVNLFPEIKGPAVKIYYIYSKAHQNIKKIKFFGEYLKEKFQHDSH